MCLGGTKLWLRPAETQVLSFLAASVVKLDQRGFIRGRYRPQCPVPGVACEPTIALERYTPFDGSARVTSGGLWSAHAIRLMGS
jgi:hypothetical protein